MYAMQKGGTSDASFDQTSASSSSHTFLPAPVLSYPDIVSVMQSGRLAFYLK